MGILNALIPWYRWTDRFGIRVICFPLTISADGIDYIVPPGYRIQPLSIRGQLFPGDTLAKKYILIETHRGSDTFFQTMPAVSFSGLTTPVFNFAAGATREGTAALSAHLNGVLPTELYLLAGDRLHIHHSHPDPADRWIDVVINFKEWND